MERDEVEGEVPAILQTNGSYLAKDLEEDGSYRN